MRSSIASAIFSYLASAVAGDERDRHLELGEPVPHRFHRARAEHAQAVREVARRQAAPFAQARCVGRDGREQRLREPALEERVDAVALDRVGQRLVGDDALGARRRSAMPAVELTSTSAVHELGPVEREPQREAAAHRVADVDRAPALRRRSRSRSRRTCRAPARRARSPRTTRRGSGAHRATTRPSA